MPKTKNIIINICYMILTIALTAGVLKLFPACGPKEDGSYMNCHRAELVSAALGAVLFVQSLLHLIFKSASAKRAVSAAMLPVTLLVFFVPGRLIPLCMLADMQCNAVMKPAVSIIAVLLVIAEAADIIMQRAKTDGEKSK